MEFKDMQVLWNEQSNEKMYVIDEDALHKQIQRKGQSVNRTVNKSDYILIGANLLCAIFLTTLSILDNEPWYNLLVPVAYLGYTVLLLVRRTNRRQDEVQFEPTMLGDLDKAIWQVNYLIKQSRGMILWYLVPLYLLVSIFLISKVWLIVVMWVVVLPLTYFASQWEIDRCYTPKLQELESLRDKLVATPN